MTSSGRSGYWTVIIVCKDRPKLLFDTVCTLADCGYEVFHATVDSVNKVAQQEVCPLTLSFPARHHPVRPYPTILGFTR